MMYNEWSAWFLQTQWRKMSRYGGTMPLAIPWACTIFFWSLHTRSTFPSCMNLPLIHVNLYIQYAMKKPRLYVHLVDLPIHGRSYCKNASNGDKFGHEGNFFVEIHYSHLKIFLCYQPHLICSNFIRCILLGAKQPFVSYTLLILWKVGQFPRTIGHEQVVVFLHWGLPLVCSSS